MTLQDTHKKLRKRRLQNILLNFLCILIAGSGLIWVANYFWKYIHYEITNDAFIDQYVSPLNIRASGYIKEVRFKEHQYVHQGDTLLILDNREYQIKVKEAEAALLDVKGSKEVLHSGIETSQTNIAVQDANIAEAAVRECNSGFYCFDAQALFRALAQVSDDNAQGEFYLTDVLSICREAGRAVLALPTEDPMECLGVNSRVQLAQATKIAQRRINKAHMAAGVTMWDPESAWIGPEVEIASDVELLPNVMLLGKARVPEGSVIGPNVRLVDGTVG